MFVAIDLIYGRLLKFFEVTMQTFYMCWYNIFPTFTNARWYQVHSTIVSDSRHSCHGQMSACISLCLDDGQQKRKPDDSFIKIWLDRDSKIDVEFRCGLTQPHPAGEPWHTVDLCWIGGRVSSVSQHSAACSLLPSRRRRLWRKNRRYGTTFSGRWGEYGSAFRFSVKVHNRRGQGGSFCRYWFRAL